MKWMNVIVLSAFVLLPAILIPVSAQPAPATPRTEVAKERLEQIRQRLALTPEQIEQVRPILADEMEKLRALRDRADGSNRRSRMKLAREARGIREAADDKLRKVLSNSQMDELKQMREEWRDEMRERRNP